MKKYINYWIIFIFISLSGCKEYEVGQFPVDTTPPQPVSNAVVENLSGKVKITYKLPNETDLLYVKAVYYNSLGVKMEVKASSFKNTLEIPGFGRSAEQTIQLITVDRSQNESKAVPVVIHPLDSPIYGIFETLQAEATWGGVKLTWENQVREQLVVKILKDEDDGSKEIETFYSTVLNANNSARGLDSTLQTFRIFIKDVYENTTDTLVTTLKPWFEMVLPSSEFTEMPLATNIAHSPNYSSGFKVLWDGSTLESGTYYLNILENATYSYSYLTIDMAKTYRLSRVKVWPRTRYAYALHNPRYFEFWGTNDPAVAADKDSWAGWTKLMECESYKPSGPGDVTEEDQARAEAGEEYEFPDDVINVRYLRFRCNETWTTSKSLNLSELRLWGQEEK